MNCLYKTLVFCWIRHASTGKCEGTRTCSHSQFGSDKLVVLPDLRIAWQGSQYLVFFLKPQIVGARNCVRISALSFSLPFSFKYISSPLRLGGKLANVTWTYPRYSEMRRQKKIPTHLLFCLVGGDPAPFLNAQRQQYSVVFTVRLPCSLTVWAVLKYLFRPLQ